MSYKIDFTGEVALITGGAGGIGGACTRLFSEAGAQCVITGRRSEEDVKAFLDEVEKDSGIRPYYIQNDIADEEAVKAMVKEAGEKFGRIDSLVCNAGGMGKDLSHNFDLNVRGGVIALIEAAVPYMGKSDLGGRVVIVSSTTVLYGGHRDFDRDYIAAKGGSEALTRYYARNLIKKNIRVNCVLPGAIMSDAMSKGDEAKAREHYDKVIPIGHAGSTTEQASGILFLCSKLAYYITGYTYAFDGGRSKLAY